MKQTLNASFSECSGAQDNDSLVILKGATKDFSRGCGGFIYENHKRELPMDVLGSSNDSLLSIAILDSDDLAFFLE